MKPLNAYPEPHPQGISQWEDGGTDFSFYRGAPVKATHWQRGAVVSVIAVVFLAVALPALLPVKGLFWPFIPAVVLAAILLIALARVAPGH
jgi:hypothetical protein